MRVNVSDTYKDNNDLEYSFIASMVVKVAPHNIVMEVWMNLGAVAVCQ